MRSFGVIHLFRERDAKKKTDFFRHGGYRFQKSHDIFLAFYSRQQTTTNGYSITRVQLVYIITYARAYGYIYSTSEYAFTIDNESQMYNRFYLLNWRDT